MHPYVTLREQVETLTRRNAELESELQWHALKFNITTIAIEPDPPDYPTEAREAWNAVLGRLIDEGILFQFAAPWLVAQGYRVNRIAGPRSGAPQGE
jgi:hypothetical protein